MCAKRIKRRKSVLLRLLVIAVIGYMTFNLAGVWNTLNEDKARLRELEAERDVSAARVEELKTLLEDGSQAEIIERAARDRLGYVYADEEIYIDISGS